MTDTGSRVGTLLGISVVDNQIVSAVRGPDGRVLASNLVDLTNVSEAHVAAAIEELVDSVPMDIDQVGLTVADDTLRQQLTADFAAGPNTPDWFGKVGISDFPTALAEVGRNEATRDGVVAIVELGRDTAPSAGPTLVTVDVATGRHIGTSGFTPGNFAPVTDPGGASALAAAVAAMPGGDAVTSVICTGPGAQVPGVAPAFEYAIQRPVIIADQPSLASALSAAKLAAAAAAPTTITRVTSPSTGRRWWFIGAAIGAAIALGAIAITAVLAAEQPATETSPVTVTVTGAATTRTMLRTEAADTVTQTETETTTVTRTPRPVTSTVTETAPPETTTVTETAPVIPSNPYGSPNSNGNDDGNNGFRSP